MFSGLNKFIKYILPKRLFYRALIIVAAPTIILQLIITIVFYDSVWIKANKNTTRSLVAQLKTIEEVYNNDKSNLDFLTDSYKNNFNFEIGINQDDFPNISGERKFSPMDRSLRRELKSTFGNNNYWFNTSKFKNAVEIKIKSENEVIEFLVPKDMVSASSVRLFLLWTTLPSIVLIIIALIFLKNQTKPLVKLAKAAERFGKGDYVNDFRASGSQEIRKAAFEFDRMAKRINRHLNQRSEMLSGISHDLRTPLTRLKLGLSFLPEEQRALLEKDVEDMNLLLNEFLDFAKQDNETDLPTEDISPTVLVNELIENFRRTDIQIECIGEIGNNFFKLKPFPIKRALENLINNADRYGKKILIEKKIENNFLILSVHDDGPGIDEAQYDEVLQPFTRLDPSRNQNKGSGVGLGLPIAKEIVEGQGGRLKLSKSNILSGLNAALIIPIDL